MTIPTEPTIEQKWIASNRSGTIMNEPTLQEIVDEQSRTITKLCEAIDPTHTHGPETDKICAYAVKCREFAENSVLLKRIENLENLMQLQQLGGMCDGPQHGGSVTEYRKAMNKANGIKDD